MSQVYETIELNWLAKLAPFADATHLETVVLYTAQSNGIHVHSLTVPQRGVCVGVCVCEVTWQRVMVVSFG